MTARGLGHGRLLDPVPGGNIARIGGFVPGLYPDEPGVDPAH